MSVFFTIGGMALAIVKAEGDTKPTDDNNVARAFELAILLYVVGLVPIVMFGASPSTPVMSVYSTWIPIGTNLNDVLGVVKILVFPVALPFISTVPRRI